VATLLGDEGGLRLSDCCQASFEGGLERAGDEAVLGLAGVVLAPGTLGLVARALERDLEEADASCTGLIGLGKGLRRRGERSWFQRGEHFGHHRALDAAPADAPAGGPGADDRLSDIAHIAR
jgi:hypothetical protein